jgi:hypothetical protein
MIDEPHSLDLCRTLHAMWRLAQPKEIKMSDREFHQNLEQARQDGRDSVNTIKSTFLVVADVLSLIKEIIETLAKNA